MSACATEPIYSVPLGDGLALLFPLLIDGVATSISGWVDPTLTVTTDLDDPAAVPLCTLTLGAGIEAYGTQKWLATFLGATHFAAAALGHYRYAFRVVDPLGATQTLETGYIKFTPAGPAPAA